MTLTATSAISAQYRFVSAFSQIGKPSHVFGAIDSLGAYKRALHIGKELFSWL